MVSAVSSTMWMPNMLTNNRLMLGGKRLTSLKSIKPLRRKILGMASTRETDPVRMTLPSKPACWNIFLLPVTYVQFVRKDSKRSVYLCAI